MDLFIRGLFFIIFSLQTTVYGYTLTKYNFHDNCGRTLDPLEVAGELIFDSREIHYHDPRYRTRHCEVTISPKEIHSSNFNRVLFYFTEFNIGRRCVHNNLTVIDGRQLNVRVQGIPEVLCGHNTSLEDNSTVFTSIKPDIRLQYEWSEYGETFSGTFKLVFVAFFDGHCKTKDGVFACENDRCISSEVMCKDGINSCGDGKDSKCDMIETLTDIAETIAKYATEIGIVIAVIVFIFILKKMVYDRLRRKYGSIRNVPLCECLCRGPSSSSCNCKCTCIRRCFDGVLRRFQSCRRRIEVRPRRPSRQPSIPVQEEPRLRINYSRDTREPRRHSPISMDETSRQTSVSVDEISINSSEDDRFPYADYDNHQQQQQQQQQHRDADETALTDSSQLPTYDTFVNESHRYPPTNPDPPPYPSAPPPPSDVAPPPSYADVMANNDRYVHQSSESQV